MGAIWTKRKSGKTLRKKDFRSPFEVDYARIVHAGAFRRLQGKTQILNLGDSDFYRTRLTHSMEVAQIAGGLLQQIEHTSPAEHPARSVLPCRPLVQTLGLAHDLGHPPFGHGGEVALNYCMRDHGGFEGNGQTLRILAKLESYSSDHGADLTRRSLLGLLKYPVTLEKLKNPTLSPKLLSTPSTLGILDPESCAPPKSYMASEENTVQWLLQHLSQSDRKRFTDVKPRDGKHSKTRHKSLDCSFMDIADDIAYGVHDLEDATELGLIKREAFQNAISQDICRAFLEEQISDYPDKAGNNPYDRLLDALFSQSGKRKMMISLLVSHFIRGVEFIELPEFEEPLLRYRVQMASDRKPFLDALKKLVADELIFSPNVQHLEFKGQQMVVQVFEVIASNPKRLLPAEHFHRFDGAGKDLRIVCDYIASMTDATLLKTYDRLFSPHMGSVFDRL
ncbi:anti-phage deoxyguanosine triphosphatase [Polycladidibacter hongkongensis]|uniref:anti-phage deoxyguanosine triphosphatase n=1 Tax=Polycladidibacter hongkongensis TaxID=1647556 RepID=UPI0008352BCB|nr:anti-phage deoxyguanosine triphosphatase [Pseudovibrio hongkongensis]